jgi:hypothetical protein
VQFICRYRDENDYCIDGRRIIVYDDGRVRNRDRLPVSAEEVQQLRTYLLDEYAAYCRWHVERQQQSGYSPPLQPFGPPAFPLHLDKAAAA